MVSMYISGTRCTTREKKMLVELLAGKQKKEDRENFQDVLDSEMKKLEPDTRPKLNDSNKMQ